MKYLGNRTWGSQKRKRLRICIKKSMLLGSHKEDQRRKEKREIGKAKQQLRRKSMPNNEKWSVESFRRKS